MFKRIITSLLILAVMLMPMTAWADSDDVKMTEYQLHNDNMHISLPDGWYFNTPRDIDEDFLEVSENSKRKLTNYLTDNDIDFNIVSKDLLNEINVILVNSSQTKTLYDFNKLEDSYLKEKAKALVDQGTQEEKKVKTTYKSYSLEKFNKCTFMVLEGTVEDENGKIKFYQYTTTVNGFGITVTYRASKGADYEAGKQLLEKIVHTLDIKEIKEVDMKTNAYKQLLTPIILIVGVVGFTAFLFIRQLIKNKKEEKAKKAKQQ